MNTSHEALKSLLSGVLPLENVGQHLREAARRALMSGDRHRMEVVARVIAGELLRRGDLLHVAVQGQTAGHTAWCLLRDQQTLVDLSPIGGILPDLSSLAPSLEQCRVPLDNGHRDADPEPVREVDGVLGAMEEAQNLEIGGPLSGDIGAVLTGIMGLLARFTPQFRLLLLLHEPLVELPEGSPLLVCDVADRQQGWLGMREQGSAAWIPHAGELPPCVRQALDPDMGNPATVAVPLLAPERIDLGESGREIGLLFVVAAENWERESLLRLAMRLSRFVTSRWHQQEEVNQRIHTDSLTRVFNRAYFDSQFTLELERARRSNVPLTLIIADLDHFKAVNDRLGHHVGDKVLKTVAQRLQEELRRIDHVCRIGGEEFALVLPDTSQAAALDVMTRLVNASYTTATGDDEAVPQVTATFSFGAVTFPDAGADAFELYRKADAMLYLSKDSGRNRCHFWSSSGDHVELLPQQS